MATKTLIELNHDHHDRMNSPEFLLALQDYLARPSLMTADLLSEFGVRIYGMAHSDDTKTRGYADHHYDAYYKVKKVI